MSTRRAAVLLFVVAFLTVPFPMLGLSGSVVPAARFLQLAAVLVALLMTEGAGGMVGLFTGLLAAHAFIYTGLLVAAAWGLGRLVLVRLASGPRLWLTLSVSLGLIGIASFASVYDTQFHHASVHARVWELYR